VGLAAGFDKNAEVFSALFGIGFGAVEVGTLTGQAQPGNPQPRLFRLPRDRALVNRMGFNNKGSAAAASFLSTKAANKGEGILGINIGKTKIVPSEQAADDYEHSARLLVPHADYLVVNVSSPNTPGLRDLQAVESLRPILQRVRSTIDQVSPARRVPMLVKIAPDLSDEDVLAVADLALELELDGIVATNTTIGRSALSSSPAEVDACGAGGLSGAPLKRRSLEVLSLLYRQTKGRLLLVSVGGIESTEDAWERIVHGASLIQIYSSLVYAGPGLPSRLSRGLARKLAESGFSRLADAVGSATDVAYAPPP
jgi:dihydroorotate dehydrogenase